MAKHLRDCLQRATQTPKPEQKTLLTLLPTPARNFKGTVEWLSDELFHCVVEK